MLAVASDIRTLKARLAALHKPLLDVFISHARPDHFLEAAMVKALEIINLRQPSEVREFPYGQFEVFHIAGQVIGRATYQPGWRWTEYVGPMAGTELCEVEHLGLVVSGRAAVWMADETERVIESGDLFAIPPGHDSWVVGDEPYVSLHLLGAGSYTLPAR